MIRGGVREGLPEKFMADMDRGLRPQTVCGIESMDQVFAEIQPLLKSHFAELSYFKDIALDPDWAKYRTMQEQNALRIFTARQLGELVGYAVFAVHPAMHYQGSLQAIQDVFYVDPKHRGGRVGWRLLRYAERWLREEGVQVVRHHVKRGHPELAELLQHCEYELEDLLYVKRLDR